ncbi:MAG: PAS domain S-box protein, partial [Chromatiaceae bacterium]
MPAPHQPATILVLTSQENEAERIVTALRNGGLSVRGLHSAEGERIHQLVERGDCDLVVCCGYDPEVDLDSTLARHRELHTDIPLILVSNHQEDAGAMIPALRAGARDFTERDQDEHLQLVVARELSDLWERRRAHDLEHRLRRCEEQGRDLIETTGEAVAFVQDGLHLHANPAYLELFGFRGFEDLVSATFLDLIAAEQRRPVRDYLREREIDGRQDVQELSTTCLRPGGSHFPVRLSALATESDGEPCLRLVLRQHGGGDSVGEGARPQPGATGVPGYDALLAALEGRVGPDGAA